MYKVTKSLISEYYSCRNFKLLLMYLILGVFIFTSSNIGTQYGIMFYHIFSHRYLIALFLLPIIIFSNYKLVNSKNSNFIIRFSSRKKIFEFDFLTIIINSLLLMLIFSFICLLFCNLFASRDFFIIDDPYYNNVKNILVLFINFIKQYIFFVSISFISVYILKRLNILIALLFNFIIIILFFIDFEKLFISWIFPTHYLCNIFIFDNIIQNILASSIYLTVFFIVSVLLYKSIIYNGDI